MDMIIQAIGGLGLFLLGMIIMTNGLRRVAGDTMRTALIRFTKSPYSGAMTGAVSTAVLQSSSATTVAAIGFVGAGLLHFSEALGIIFGANIGTTITGWLVALLGFKLQLATIVLPLIFIGTLLRLFFKERLAAVGYSMAGFGLIFVGIGMMQQGMSGFEGIIAPENLPSDTFTGRFILVGIGIIATIITQSSSAGVAAALTMLFAGAINFEQAAALVIGMDVGTTVTAAMATIGGSVNVRRTGLSHVFYNILTGISAFFLITPYVYIVDKIVPNLITENAEIALVAFHTSFNVLGVIIVLPFTGQFARLMQKMIPQKKLSLTKMLDDSLLQEQPTMALTRAYLVLRLEILALLRHTNVILGDMRYGKTANLTELQSALDETQKYLDDIELNGDKEKAYEMEQLIALMHIIDHTQRLHERCEEEKDRAMTTRESAELAQICTQLTETINESIDYIKANRFSKAVQCTSVTASQIQGEVQPLRETIIKEIAHDKINTHKGISLLQAIRWLERVSKHITKIMHHLEKYILTAGK